MCSFTSPLLLRGEEEVLHLSIRRSRPWPVGVWSSSGGRGPPRGRRSCCWRASPTSDRCWQLDAPDNPSGNVPPSHKHDSSRLVHRVLWGCRGRIGRGVRSDHRRSISRTGTRPGPGPPWLGTSGSRVRWIRSGNRSLDPSPRLDQPQDSLPDHDRASCS